MRIGKCAILALLAGLLTFEAQGAITLTDIASLDPQTSAEPSTPIQATNGRFYGITATGGSGFFGGSDGYGTVYEMTQDGTFTTLAAFYQTNGASPNASLYQGDDGGLYGATSYGGTNWDGSSRNCGTLFQITSSNTIQTLAEFDNTNSGMHPQGRLVQGTDGSLYGTTTAGGTNAGGVLFRLSAEKGLETLFCFPQTNSPLAGLVSGPNGSFFGTAMTSSVGGTVFQITTNGMLTTLVSFDGTNGFIPNDLIADGQGNLYGTTFKFSFDFPQGTLFKIDASGQFTNLVQFNGTNGAMPSRLTLGSDGNIYGTTSYRVISWPNGSGWGTVFRFKPSSGKFTNLYTFSNNVIPAAGVTEGADGHLYGATINGGVGSGSIYRLNIHIPQGRPSVNIHGLIRTNQSVIVLGQSRSARPVFAIFYQLNSGEYQRANTTNYWKDWTAEINPQPGRNVLHFYSLNTVGAHSRTNTFRFSF